MASQHGETERTLGQLVADATHDFSSIIRSEITLAKAEIGADVKKAGFGAGMFAVGGVFAFLALILLLVAAAYSLVAAGLTPPVSFLIVAAVLLVVATVLVLLGKRAIGSIKGRPERAIKNAQDSVAAIRPSSS